MLNYEEDLKLIFEKMDYVKTDEEKQMILNMVLGMLQFS